MTFVKGISGNPGGRKKGTPNRLKGDIRQFFENFIRKNADGLQADFDALSPKDRIFFIEKISKIVLPQLSTIGMVSARFNPYDEMTDEELQEKVNHLTRVIAGDTD